MFNKRFEHFEVGETWRSRGRTITESDLVMFSAFSGDWHPLHTDKEYAENNTPFKQRIAHGMLVLSAATGLQIMEPEIIVAFYGIDHLRFIQPTFINDTIHVELEVTELADKENGTGVVTAIQKIIKQTGEPVTTGVLKVLINKEKR
ncbi:MULTISPECIES: MaoC/PaaZ C-terminal domain-containing protein [unclassified Sporosarcina]|uniref:MaoC/PaaZ C-terminal domain-containing protein n=1 Tax=unclassified Sporosarcina TaxID=2647733 RepID=UPI000C172E47|nr:MULTISPECIES: MaoC/PaaZ C-terminal domain-containing protein [unclassified Sporosarcina]PID03856.1 dehydratase [Sporosarcina sp. P30]PID07868.1 dehydratase [Sporosarcina sp. P31]PID10664.1 dehydratase [Sporosarcina sp. P32b]